MDGLAETVGDVVGTPVGTFDCGSDELEDTVGCALGASEQKNDFMVSGNDS